MTCLRKPMGRVILVALTWALASPLPAQEPVGARAAPVGEEDRTVVIPRTPREPELEWYVDGAVDNGDDGDGGGFSSNGSGPTASAAQVGPLGVEVSGFRQREPGDGTPVSQETAAYLSFDDDNLYVVFVCRDDPSRVRASFARREDIGSDDAVVVYLDTFRDRQRAYFFQANPRGIQRDGIRTEGQDEDLSFDAIWESDGRLTHDGYVVRLTIPFRSLRFPRTPTQTWGIALGRTIRRSNEESYWPYVTERVNGFVPQFGEAQGLGEISPGLNVQANPYTTFARARILDDDIPGYRNLGEERVGVDGKAVLFDALTLDATVNPDYSQVETDDPQVTLNERFEVFFPEKRPFFLENAGYFQTPVNLFFSRRMVDPGAGLRLTGQMGRWGVAAIGMNDRTPEEIAPDDPLAGSDARVGVLRVQRQIGEESSVGFLASDRALEGSFNRIVSVDSRLRVGDTWAFTGQLIRSESLDLEGGRPSGYGGMAEVEREGRSFQYTGSYLHFDPGFTAPLGFVQRVGIRQTEHAVEYNWQPEDSPVVEWGPSAAVLYNWDPSGRLLDREVGAQFQVEVVGETQVELEHTRFFEHFDGLDFRPHSTQVAVATEWLDWLALGASYEWGTAVNHDPAEDVLPFLTRAAEAEVELTFRPTPALRWDQAYVSGRLSTDAGERIATEHLLRTKLNYQFNRFLSARAIVDWEAEDANVAFFDADERERDWGADLLLTYLLNPGTAVYVGYTDRYQNVRLFGDPAELEFQRSPTTSVGRQLFVKLSYLLRF